LVNIRRLDSFSNWQLNYHIRQRISHARQYKAVALFINAQPGPCDAVCHLSFEKLANAGAAGSVATGTVNKYAQWFEALTNFGQIFSQALLCKTTIFSCI
jgi:hypothetical protein